MCSGCLIKSLGLNRYASPPVAKRSAWIDMARLRSLAWRSWTLLIDSGTEIGCLKHMKCTMLSRCYSQSWGPPILVVRVRCKTWVRLLPPFRRIQEATLIVFETIEFVSGYYREALAGYHHCQQFWPNDVTELNIGSVTYLLGDIDVRLHAQCL